MSGLIKLRLFEADMRKALLAFFVSISLFLAGCLDDSTVDELKVDPVEEPELFPEWNELTDDGTNWSSSSLSGEAYIVIFSAQWCNSPCHNLMHNIWSVHPELPVMVMSTDNESSITFEEWHDSADAYDDEENDTGVDLTTYRFMLGDEEGQAMGITSPGTVMYVNSDGVITWKGTASKANNEDTIREQWAIANGE